MSPHAMSGMGTCPPVKPDSQSGKVSAKPSHAIRSRGLSPQVSAHLLPVFTGTRFAATRAVGVCCNRSFCVAGALLRAGAGIPRPLYAQTHSGKTLSIICALAGNIFFNKKTFPPTPFQKNFGRDAMHCVPTSVCALWPGRPTHYCKHTREMGCRQVRSSLSAAHPPGFEAQEKNEKYFQRNNH